MTFKGQLVAVIVDTKIFKLSSIARFKNILVTIASIIDVKARKIQRRYKLSGKKLELKETEREKTFLPSRKGGKLNQHVSENKELGGHFCHLSSRFAQLAISISRSSAEYRIHFVAVSRQPVPFVGVAVINRCPLNDDIYSGFGFSDIKLAPLSITGK